MDGFEWDDEKHLKNKVERGLGFDTASEIFSGFHLEWLDDRFNYGEERFIALGMVENRVLVVVYTWRQGRRRIISARKANKDEKATYEEGLARDGPAAQD